MGVYALGNRVTCTCKTGIKPPYNIRYSFATCRLSGKFNRNPFTCELVLCDVPNSSSYRLLTAARKTSSTFTEKIPKETEVEKPRRDPKLYCGAVWRIVVMNTKIGVVLIATGVVLLLLTSFSAGCKCNSATMQTTRAEECSRRKRSAANYDQTLSSFFQTCLVGRDPDIGAIFPSVPTSVNFVIQETDWFQRTNEVCSIRTTLADVTQCWIDRTDSIIKDTSTINMPTRQCICDYADVKPPYCDTIAVSTPSPTSPPPCDDIFPSQVCQDFQGKGDCFHVRSSCALTCSYCDTASGAPARARRAVDSTDLIQELYAAFGSCIVDNILTSTIKEFPSLGVINIGSVNIFLIDFFTQCSYKLTGTANSCEIITTSGTPEENMLAVFEAALKDNAPLIRSFQTCVDRLEKYSDLIGTHGSWTEWSACTRDCVGVQTRNRSCEALTCNGKNGEIRSCDTSGCSDLPTCAALDPLVFRHLPYAKNTFEQGESIIFRCAEGFFRPQEYTYDSGKCEIDGKFNPPPFRCVVPYCAAPDIRDRYLESFDQGIYAVDATVNYTCVEGFKSPPNITYSSAKCEFIGGFNEDPFTCERETGWFCKVPDFSSYNLLSSSRDMYVLVGEEIEYECQYGYRKPGGLDYDNATCLTSGSFDHEPFTCLELENVTYNEWSEWSECTVTCGGGIWYRSRGCGADDEKIDVAACVSLGPAFEIRECGEKECKICPPRASLDIIALLDSSRSISQYGWNLMIDFMKKLIGEFTVANNSTNFGILRFNRHVDAKSQILLKHHSNNASGLLESLDKIPYRGGGSRIGKALKHVKDVMLHEDNGNRADFPDLVLILTDEKPKAEVKSLEELKQIGVEVFVLAIPRPKRRMHTMKLMEMAEAEENFIIMNEESVTNLTDIICRRETNGTE